VKQQGSVLVYILATVAILALLGGSVVHSAMVEQRAAVNHSQGIRSFFVAEAGLNFGLKYIRDNQATLPNHLSVGSEVQIYSSPGFGGTHTAMSDIGELLVTLVRTADGWRVESKGLEQGATSLVGTSVTIGGTTGFTPAQEQILMHGVYLYGALEMVGSSRVTSNVFAHAVDISGSSRIVGNVQVPSPFPLSGVRFPTWGRQSDFITGTITHALPQQPAVMPTFPPLPTGLPSRSDLRVTGSSTHTITADGIYNAIEVSGSSILTINVGSTDRILRLRNFAVSGNARVFVSRQSGSSARLLLYVENEFDLNGSSRFNFLTDTNPGDASSVVLYYIGEEDLDFSGNVRWAGNIAVQRADIDLSGSSSVVGNIVSGGGIISLSGNVRPRTGIVYAPNAHVDIGGSSALLGQVVAKSMEVDGSARVESHAGTLDSFLPLARDLGILGAGQGVQEHSWSGR